MFCDISAGSDYVATYVYNFVYYIHMYIRISMYVAVAMCNYIQNQYNIKMLTNNAPMILKPN